MPEWFIGALSKSVVALSVTVGSNPTLSAFYTDYIAKKRVNFLEKLTLFFGHGSN